MRPFAPLALLAAAVAVTAPSPAPAAAPAPTYGVKVYELFQDGPRLVLEERTSRALEPHDPRNVALDTTWPPQDQPPLLVMRSRDHVAWFASYWREDETNEFGKLQVAVQEDPGATEPGVSGLRIRVEARTARPASPALTASLVPDSASYQVRLYEVLQRQTRIVLEERTTRAFGPGHLRGMVRGEVIPPEDQPALEIWKSRDHLGFYGAAARLDDVTEKATWDVRIAEVPGDAPMGATLVRVQIGDARERGPQPARRVRHPQHDRKQAATP